MNGAAWLAWKDGCSMRAVLIADDEKDSMSTLVRAPSTWTHDTSPRPTGARRWRS